GNQFLWGHGAKVLKACGKGTVIKYSFWRDRYLYITPKLSEINQTKSPGGLLNPTPAVIFPLSGDA
ncbi:MAG: hypothetical protein ABJA76_05515, partial [Mucilaginibacter sp.]